MIKTLKKITFTVFALVLTVATVMLAITFFPTANNSVKDYSKPAYTASDDVIEGNAADYTIKIDDKVGTLPTTFEANQEYAVDFQYTGDWCNFSASEQVEGAIKSIQVFGGEEVFVDCQRQKYVGEYSARIVFKDVSLNANVGIDFKWRIVPKKVSVKLYDLYISQNKIYRKSDNVQVSSSFKGAYEIKDDKGMVLNMTLSDIGYKIEKDGESIVVVKNTQNENYGNYNLVNAKNLKAEYKQVVSFEGWIPTIAMGGIALACLITFFILLGVINKLRKSM